MASPISSAPLTPTTVPSGTDSLSPSAPAKATPTPAKGVSVSDGWSGTQPTGAPVQMDAAANSAPILSSAPESSLWAQPGVDPVTGPAEATGTLNLGDPVEALDNAVSSFDDAMDNSKQINHDISTEMSEVNPLLTVEQKQDYIQSFAQAQSDASTALNSAADQVSTALQTLQKASPDAYKKPENAKSIFEAYERLADSPAHAAQVFAWTQTLHDDVRAAFAQALGGDYESRLQGMISKAVATVAKGAIADCNGDIGAAVRKICGTLATLTQVKDLSDLKDVPDLLQNVDALAKDSTIDPVAFIKDHWSSLSQVGKSLAGTSLGLYLMKAGKAALKGDFVKALMDLSKGDNGFLPLIATQVLTPAASNGVDSAVTGMGMASTLLSMALRQSHTTESLSDGFDALGAAAAAAAKASASQHHSPLDHILSVVGGAIGTLPRLLSTKAGVSRLENAIKRMAGVSSLSDLAGLFGSFLRSNVGMWFGKLTAEVIQRIARKLIIEVFNHEVDAQVESHRADRQRSERMHEELKRKEASMVEKFRAELAAEVKRVEAQEAMAAKPA